MSILTTFQFRRPEMRQAHMFFSGAVIILVAGVLFGYGKVQLFLDERKAVQEHTEIFSTLEKETSESAKAVLEAKEAFGKELESFQALVSKVLPGSESFTELTKQFDNFFDEHSQIDKNPIIAGSLRFGHGTKLKDSPFYTLPVSLTVESSKENFFTFLNYLETSGSLETGARLMDVQSIQLNFSNDESGKESISFTVDLRAYYRQTDGNTKSQTPAA